MQYFVTFELLNTFGTYSKILIQKHQVDPLILFLGNSKNNITKSKPGQNKLKLSKIFELVSNG